MKRRIKTITICSSAAFYQEVLDIQKTLRKMGFIVLIPKIANVMKRNNDFEVSHYKTWFGNKDDYKKKKALMDGHFKKVLNADAILVVNNKKNGIDGYIGGNVLLEMFLAHLYKKPIYILNDVVKSLPLEEEILGLYPILLHGEIDKISA